MKTLHVFLRRLPGRQRIFFLFLLYFSMLLANAAQAAEVQFIARGGTLDPVHVYDGGWDHFVGGGVALFDCNQDGKIDIFAAGGTNPASLYINSTQDSEDLRFTSAEIQMILGTTGAYPINLDDDGLTDLIVLRNGANLLLKGRGDCTFEDAGDALNLPNDAQWTTAFSATWEDGQELPTLAIGNYVDATDPDGPFGTCDTNWLLRPEGHRYAAPQPLHPGFCTLSMLFSDWKLTGQPMLRISNDRQYYVRDGYEQMWMLNPLRELGEADGWPRLQLWGMGIASRDISGDGLPEVMLTSMGDQMLMLNDGNQFATAPFDIGVFSQRPFTGGDGRPSTGWHAEFADVNNDGLNDLFIAKGNVDQMPGMAMRDPNNLLIQQADGTFLEQAAVSGVASMARARGAGLVDLNNDGLLDLVVLNRRAPLEIWQNATEGAGNWTAISLSQPAPNTDAIGAIVEVITAERVQTRELTIGGGHVSGSLSPLHFGLGNAQTFEVHVTWPDGRKSAPETFGANQAISISRP